MSIIENYIKPNKSFFNFNREFYGWNVKGLQEKKESDVKTVDGEQKATTEYLLKIKESKVNIKKFVELVLDMLVINHRSNIAINDASMCRLGNADFISHKKVEETIRTFSQKLPSVIIRKCDGQIQDGEENGSDSDSNESSNRKKNTTEDDASNLEELCEKLVTEWKESKVLKGYLFNELIQRSVLDALKCRIDLKMYTKINYQISCSNLIAFLLEICDAKIQKRILIPVVEQLIPIPIIYNMLEIGDNGKVKCFARDTLKFYFGFFFFFFSSKFNLFLHSSFSFFLRLASHAKMLSDGMSQTEISRNRALVMFIGSNRCEGKSTFLTKLFKTQPFNTCDKKVKNPLHNSSIDIIYLGELHQCSYHILDVHGKITDPFFSPKSMSRTDVVVQLAKLCHCVVIQVTKREFEFKDSDYMGIKAKKCPEIIQLLNQLKADAPNCKIALVVKDVNSKKISQKILENVFYAPEKEQQNGLQQCINELKEWLNKHTDTLMPAPNDQPWWEKIESLHLALPFECVKLFDTNVAGQSMSQTLFAITPNNNCCLLNNGKGNMMNWKKKGPEQNAVNAKTNPLFDLYQKYCLLPLYCDKNPAEGNKDEKLAYKAWQQEEMLYVLEDVLRERNRVCFAKEREECKNLKRQYETEGDKEKKERLRKNIEKLTKEIEAKQITAYDLFKDAMAMIDFIEKYK
ncbi:hypothetical protein RFI_25833, partial [Reticulomyxa filosa]